MFSWIILYCIVLYCIFTIGRRNYIVYKQAGVTKLFSFLCRMKFWLPVTKMITVWLVLQTNVTYLVMQNIVGRCKFFPFVHLSFRLSVHLPTHLSIYPFIFSSFHLFIHPFFHPFIFSFFHFFILPFFTLSSFHTSKYSSVYISPSNIYSSISLPSIYLFIRPSIYFRYRAAIKRSQDSRIPSATPVPPTQLAHSGTETLLKADPKMVFFCRKIYDYRMGRIMKNPFMYNSG